MSASDALGKQFAVRPMEGFDNRAFEAHVDGQRIGEVYVSPANTGGLAVNNIAVDPAHRRKGVASALYQAAASAHGVPIDHSKTSMTPVAKKAVKRLAASQPGLHRESYRDTNGNRKARPYR